MDALMNIGKIVLFIYIGSEFVLMYFVQPKFIITRYVGGFLLKLFMGKYSCKVNVHHWKYSTKNSETEGNSNQVTLYQRECTGVCNKKQFTYYPQHSDLFDYWRDVEPK